MNNNLAFDFRLPFTLNTSMTYGNQLLLDSATKAILRL